MAAQKYTCNPTTLKGPNRSSRVQVQQNPSYKTNCQTHSENAVLQLESSILRMRGRKTCWILNWWGLTLALLAKLVDLFCSTSMIGMIEFVLVAG